MRIGLLCPSVYMSPTKYGEMIFAPRDLVTSLADGLVLRGHEVFLFTAPDVHSRASIIGGDEKLLNKDYVEDKLLSAPPERLTWGSFYGVKWHFELDLTARCYEMARQGKLDIVHSYHDRLAHYFEEATHVPSVYTLHDPISTNPKSLAYWLLSRFPHHRYIAISDDFQRNNALGLTFVGTVHHGVDVSLFPFQNKPSDYLLFMGRLIPEKGLHEAITAAITAGMQLEIGTQFPKEGAETPYFTEKIKPYLSNPLIGEPGMVTGADKMLLFKQAQALLFPIRWDEPFGMVMIEAMACGTPVIAYNRGSVSEIVVDGLTGFIVEPDDSVIPNDKAQMSKWIIKKRGVEGLVEAIKRIGEIDRAACRRHVEEHFTIDKMVEGYEKAYKKALKK